MGYAKTGQRGCGIHLRQFSRAFIFDDGKTKAAYVTVDACMMNHGVKQAVSRYVQLIETKAVWRSDYRKRWLVLLLSYVH